MEYSKLLEILGCPVCFETAVSPIYQCSKGHILCCTCIETLAGGLCPICRCPLPQEKIRSLSTEQLLESTDVKCKHHSAGCQSIVKAINILQHLQDCEYREDTSCRRLGYYCHEKYSLINIAFHCRVFHNSDFEKIEKNCDVVMAFSASPLTMLIPNHNRIRFFEDGMGNFFILTAGGSNSSKLTYELLLKHRPVFNLSPKLSFSVVSTSSNARWEFNSLNFENKSTFPSFISLKTFDISVKNFFIPKDLDSTGRMNWHVWIKFPHPLPVGSAIPTPPSTPVSGSAENVKSAGKRINTELGFHGLSSNNHPAKQSKQ